MGQYQTIKTQAGLGLEAAAETGGPAIKLVSMSLGDGGGSAVQPSVTQTALIHEVDRVTLNSLSQNTTDATQWVAEAVFPADHGGYTVREVGLWTDAGVLFAVANFPDTYKPAPSEGTAGQLLVSLNFRAQNSNNITLVVDGNLQLATINYVDEKTAAVSASVQAEQQRAEQAEAGLVSGTSGLPKGGSAGLALFSDPTGQPQYTDGANGERALALQSAFANYATTTALNKAVTAETQRAENAEEGLLPLAGGTLTGTVTGNLGGSLPQVLGQTGRVVEQAFAVSGSGATDGYGNAWVSFPTPFQAGTTPIISFVINREPGYTSRCGAFGNIYSNNAPNVSATGFSFQPIYLNDQPGTSSAPWTLHVRALGVI